MRRYFQEPAARKVSNLLIVMNQMGEGRGQPLYRKGISSEKDKNDREKY